MARKSKKDRLESLQAKVEEACGCMRHEADLLDEIANKLPNRRRDEVFKLRLASDRLRALATALTLESRAGDARTIGLLAKAAGAVCLTIATGAVSGLFQGAGATAYNHLAPQAAAASETTASRLSEVEKEARATVRTQSRTQRPADALEHGADGEKPIDESDREQARLSSTPMPKDKSFSGTEAARVVGITYRKLDYWASTDLVRPSLIDSVASGSRRTYSYEDLLRLRLVKSLLDSGIGLESVREGIRYFEHEQQLDIQDANLVIAGSHVVLCSRDQLIDVVRQGEGVLNILPLANVKQEVDAAIAGL